MEMLKKGFEKLQVKFMCVCYWLFTNFPFFNLYIY